MTNTSEGRVIVSGLPASEGTASGRVRIANSVADLENLQAGDVLVVRQSNPGWTLGMMRASAVIAELGGVICHAAIVAREMGLPCVVGATDAMTVLKDGQEVTVDGTSGVVYG